MPKQIEKLEGVKVSNGEFPAFKINATEAKINELIEVVNDLKESVCIIAEVLKNHQNFIKQQNIIEQLEKLLCYPVNTATKENH